MEQYAQIETSKLHPHPDNPRKNLGDITELTESVKKNGIMQNLTVVSNGENEFTVIIGHRRLAAAQAAGLETVPCRIADLTDAEQVLMMLEENMQRTDLTPLEQAYGFQMMFDFGYSADDIAEKTGFHRSTVYHRLNMAKLDRETLEELQNDESFQLNIKDIIKLEQIDDIEKRNEILKNAEDSADIAYLAERAYREQEFDKREAKYAELLEAAGIQRAPEQYRRERWTDKWNDLYRFSLEGEQDEQELDKCAALKDAEYYDRVYTDIVLIKKAEKKEEKKTEEDLKRERQAEAQKKCAEIWKQMNKDRKENIQLILDGKLQEKDRMLAMEDLWEIVLRTGSYINKIMIASFLSGGQYFALGTEEANKCRIQAENLPAIHQMLIVAHEVIKVSRPTDQGRLVNTERAEIIRDFYEILEIHWSIKMTDDEEAFLNGTHEAYINE